MALSKIIAASLADDSVSTDQIANNASISTSGSVTTTGAFTSVGIDDNADATAITIDSAENVGIGQAPETGHHANWTAVDIGNRGGLAQYKTVGDVTLTYNLYHDGAWKAKETATSGRYVIGAGPYHIWYTGASASADGAVTLTERMRLTEDGLHLGGTGSANAIDDYEEGTWTAGSAVGALNAESGSVVYTKIGRLVHFHVKGSFSNSSNSEAVEITGLPFTPSINQAAGQAMWRHVNTHFQGGVVYVKTNGRIAFYDDGHAGTAHNQLYHNEISSSNEVVLSGTYIT